MNPEMQDMLGDFLLEADEIIATLGSDLVTLETNQNDLELLNKIFRGAHTIKGSSSFLGIPKVSELAHCAESVFDKLRKGAMSVSAGVMDVLLEFVDVLKNAIKDVKNDTDVTDTGAISAKLKGLLEQPPVAEQPIVSVVLEQPQVQQQAEQICAQPKQATLEKQDIGAIRVETLRLDDLMNLVGELVLGRNRLASIGAALESRYENEPYVSQLTETISNIGNITADLQMAVMKTRLMPIGKVFSKFPRLVRDLSRNVDKEIELVVNGEDTDIDKSVADVVGDPLMHMVRNAVDHGIEMPDERIRIGKRRSGKIELAAYREGSHVVINIKDDGAGMDTNVLKARAIATGLITSAQANEMTDEEAYKLIFVAGFSTAKEVTNVSGRGVGMDVVRYGIEKLQGTIRIDSKLGVGTTFTLRLPLTLAIIQALFVETAGESFAIPLVSVAETLRVNMREIHNIDGMEVLNLRDSTLALLRLYEVFKLPHELKEDVYVVIVALADMKVGLLVDKLVGREEIVIKMLGKYMSHCEGIAGATIMGDGRVCLIVDVANVIEIAKGLTHGRRATRKDKDEILA